MLDQAEQLLNQSHPGDLARCARLLALNVAIYKMRFGEIGEEDYLRLLRSDASDSQAEVFGQGLQELLTTLMLVTGSDECHSPRELN
ncbi:MAG: hypothetical protein D6786_03645 [Gammaproteobacteria bacterium]|nr:MAG: hypothetical protein D6786_03645 [Gammaproteobacteria bacterium]